MTDTPYLRAAAQQALEALEKAVAEVKAQDVSDFADWQVLNLGVQNALTHLRAVLDAEKPTQQSEKLHSFVSTVRVMRESQRNYFKTRTRKALQESMALEKKVDHLLAEMAGGKHG